MSDRSEVVDIILYVAQGIPWGFVTMTLVIYLSAAGLEAGAIGIHGNGHTAMDIQVGLGTVDR